MAKRKGPGRPALDDPNDIAMNLRVNRRFKKRAAAYAKQRGLKKLGAAVKSAAEDGFDAAGVPR